MTGKLTAIVMGIQGIVNWAMQPETPVQPDVPVDPQGVNPFDTARELGKVAGGEGVSFDSDKVVPPREWNAHKKIDTFRVGVDYSAAEGIPLDAELISTKEIKGTYDECCQRIGADVSIKTLEQTSVSSLDIQITTEFLYGPSNSQCRSSCLPYTRMGEPIRDFSTVNKILDFMDAFKNAPQK